MAHYETRSGSSSAAAVAAGSRRATALAAVEQALERAKDHAALNAFITIDADRARQKAIAVDGTDPADVPLRGVTLAVKDNIHVAGLPNTAGTDGLRSFIAPDSSPVVERLESLGAVVIGKAGLHELAYGITSVNHAFGAVRNPVDASKIAGGSSGGTAAAVAAGIVTGGLGTDTGGSIRLPAAMTGIVGFRPTIGLYSSDAVTLISNSRDTVGLMARTVGEVAGFHAAITGDALAQPRAASGLRIGLPYRHFREMLDPDVETVFGALLARLDRAGVVFVVADMDDVVEANAETSLPVCLYETTQLLPVYLDRYSIDLSIDGLIEGIRSPDVAAVLRAAFGGAISRAAYERALHDARPRLQAAYARYFRSHAVDAVLFPTSPITARDIAGLTDGVWAGGAWRDPFETYIRNTDPASNAGIPAISIPAGRTASGLPVGAEIECLGGQDGQLLSIALGLEEALQAQG